MVHAACAWCVASASMGMTYQEAVHITSNANRNGFAGLATSGHLLTLDSAYPDFITNVNSTTYIKTVTLMSEYAYVNYYQPNRGWDRSYSNAYPRDSWVSFAPELKNYMQARSNELAGTSVVDVARRAEQVLGMSDSGTHTYAVELWVPTNLLFRPAIHWSVTDNAVATGWAGQDTSGPEFFTRSYTNVSSYQEWFVNRQDTVFGGANAFPWTGLGYTYDWYYEATQTNEWIGVSEFVVAPGLGMVVEGGALVDHYFGFAAIPEPGVLLLFVVGVGVVAWGGRLRVRRPRLEGARSDTTRT